MNYNKMRFTVGVFVIALVVALVAFLYIVLNEKGTFNKRYSYKFNTSSASSFNVGMPLKYSGFNIGVIDKISLKDDGSVEMIFSVDETNKKWLTQGSKLILKKPLIGSPHIELVSKKGTKILKQNSSIEIILSDDINDMISKLEPVVNRLIHIIDNIDSITTYLSKEDSDVIKTMKNIQLWTKRLSENKSLLTTITGDENSTKNLILALNQTKEMLNELKEASKNIHKTTSGIDPKIIDPTSKTLCELDKIAKDIKNKLDAIDGTIRAIGRYEGTLDNVREDVDVGMQKANRVLDKVDSALEDGQNKKVELP